MKKKLFLIFIPVIVIIFMLVIIIVVINNKDTKTELMTYSLNQESSISFGKYDCITLKSENTTGTYEKKYECDSDENFHNLKEELTKKAYHVSLSNDNYLVFYHDSYFYGMLFRKIKYSGASEETREICLYPFCSRIDGLYPFFLGGTVGLFNLTSGFVAEDGIYYNEIGYDSLATLEAGNSQYNSLDIYTKEDILEFFNKLSFVFCKVEGNIIYLKNSSDINYNRKTYSLKIELYDNSFKMIRI